MTCSTCCKCFKQADGSIVKRSERDGAFVYTLADGTVTATAPATFTNATEVDCTLFDQQVRRPEYDSEVMCESINGDETGVRGGRPGACSCGGRSCRRWPQTAGGRVADSWRDGAGRPRSRRQCAKHASPANSTGRAPKRSTTKPASACPTPEITKNSVTSSPSCA